MRKKLNPDIFVKKTERAAVFVGVARSPLKYSYFFELFFFG